MGGRVGKLENVITVQDLLANMQAGWLPSDAGAFDRRWMGLYCQKENGAEVGSTSSTHLDW